MFTQLDHQELAADRHFQSRTRIDGDVPPLFLVDPAHSSQDCMIIHGAATRETVSLLLLPSFGVP
jgi:hypothetical protein